MEKSIFNKKKWIKSHLDEILTMKKDGLTNKALIQSLIDDKNMPFDLSESLLSRYLKDFCVTESNVSKENEKLTKKNLRQIDRITEQNNEIQNLRRRLERVIERNMHLETDNESLKGRNRVLENKFLDGEARLKDLRRYNGYNNVHWKVADLEQKNDDMLHRMISLERHCEKIAEPLEQLDEQIRQVTIERDAVIAERDTMAKDLETMKGNFKAKLNSFIKGKIAYENQIQDLTNQNTTLQADIKRLQGDLEFSHGELQQAQEKLYIEQNKPNDAPVQLGFLQSDNDRLKQVVERLQGEVEVLNKKASIEPQQKGQDKLIGGLIGLIIGFVLVLVIFVLF